VTSLLPPQFADLERFGDWALATESARLQRRLRSSMEELNAFYSGMLPRTAAVLEYLNGFPLAELDEPQRRLMYLALSLAEVSGAVELYGQPDHPFGIDMTRFVPGESADPARADGAAR
jgi:hypothetical protein